MKSAVALLALASCAIVDPQPTTPTIPKAQCPFGTLPNGECARVPLFRCGTPEANEWIGVVFFSVIAAGFSGLTYWAIDSQLPD